MLSITAALVAAAVLGLWFTTTRTLSIVSVAALCFLYPWLVLPVFIAVSWAFHHFRIHKP
ncbi:MAG: hypothetical protein V9G11_05195 [Bifidobacterium adolescentis]|nr:hypothetical protein [Comamonadaceae bacterium]